MVSRNLGRALRWRKKLQDFRFTCRRLILDHHSGLAASVNITFPGYFGDLPGRYQAFYFGEMS